MTVHTFPDKPRTLQLSPALNRAILKLKAMYPQHSEDHLLQAALGVLDVCDAHVRDGGTILLMKRGVAHELAIHIETNSNVK